jgi:hypothetical protein
MASTTIAGRRKCCLYFRSMSVCVEVYERDSRFRKLKGIWPDACIPPPFFKATQGESLDCSHTAVRGTHPSQYLVVRFSNTRGAQQIAQILDQVSDTDNGHRSLIVSSTRSRLYSCKSSGWGHVRWMPCSPVWSSHFCQSIRRTSSRISTVFSQGLVSQPRRFRVLVYAGYSSLSAISSCAPRSLCFAGTYMGLLLAFVVWLCLFDRSHRVGLGCRLLVRHDRCRRETCRRCDV